MLAMLVAICVVPAILMAAVLIEVDYRRERGRLVRDSIGTARALVQAVDRELGGLREASQMLAASPLLDGRDLSAFRAYALETIQFSSGSNVVLSDASGQQLFNTVRPPGEPLPHHGNPEQLRRVFETARPVVSDVYIGGVLKMPVVSVDVPVIRGGKVVYDLSIGILPQRFLPLLVDQHLPPHWRAAVFDSKGTIVARTHEMERFVGHKGSPELVQRMLDTPEGSLESVTLEGVPVLSVYSRSPSSNWAVAIGIPRDEMTRELRQRVAWSISAAALLILACLVAAWVIGGYIARAVGRLREPALQLASGGVLTLPVLELVETNEVGQALVQASRLLHEAQARFRAAVESAPTAMVMADSAGTIVLCNVQAQRMFGFGEEEMLGLDVDNLLPEGLRAQHAALRREYLKAPAARPMGKSHDLYARRKDGSEFPVEIGLGPVRIDHALFVLATIADITERKRHIDALGKSNEALERSNIELQRFAYVASHDLQTPLRTVAGFVELLHVRYADKLDAQAKDWIGRIVDAIARMQTLIRELLNYSRVDVQAQPLQPVALRGVFDDVVSLLAATISETGAAVSCDELPVVMGDRSQLVQLLLNLVGNAIKYHGAEPPRVHVGARCQGREWTIVVQDNGIGIAAQYQQQIFEIFQRLHDSREYPGTGIGLAVCRRIVYRHGGRIWVESEPGRGSAFFFTLAAANGST